MAIHNTSYDAANTAVRAYLTKVGAIYWGKIFNTGSGSGKTIWLEIKDKIFSQKCCYCRKYSDKLQIEHLIMFNRQEYGLHHPGNIAPVCSDCNKRSNDGNGKHLSWEEHLVMICEKNHDIKSIDERKQRILRHINEGKFTYPRLTANEKNAIRVIAVSLYNNVITETENSLNLYGKIAEAFVNKSKLKK